MFKVERVTEQLLDALAPSPVERRPRALGRRRLELRHQHEHLADPTVGRPVDHRDAAAGPRRRGRARRPSPRGPARTSRRTSSVTTSKLASSIPSRFSASPTRKSMSRPCSAACALARSRSAPGRSRCRRRRRPRAPPASHQLAGTAGHVEPPLPLGAARAARRPRVDVRERVGHLLERRVSPHTLCRSFSSSKAIDPPSLGRRREYGV